MNAIFALSEIGAKSCDILVSQKDFVELNMEISRVMNSTQNKQEIKLPGDYRITELTFIHRGVKMNIRYE